MLEQSADTCRLRSGRLLRNRQFGGLKFRHQYPMAPYVLDFYCHEARLAIEWTAGSTTEPDKERRDTERTAYLHRQGISVIRFWNREVLQETEAVLERLHDALTPALSQREREKGLAGLRKIPP